MKSKADIIITDDHNLFRKGMIALLNEFDFVGNVYEAANGVELLELLKTLNRLPDVILLDIQMPVMDGMEAHKQIRIKYPQQKILIITMEDDEQIIHHLVSEGVNGYLLKNADPDELEAAIQGVLKNDFYFPKNMAKMLLKGLQLKQYQTQKIPHLTYREAEILELICREFTAAEMAEKLNLSVRTIEGYRQKLLEKTGAKNSAGLVVFALKNKLVFL
jgi:DNA-binding NarL/FixJ family response regulator